MGLDIFLYKFKQLPDQFENDLEENNNEPVIYTEEQLNQIAKNNNLSLSWTPVSAVEDEDKFPEDFLDLFAMQIKIPRQQFDKDKIFQAFAEEHPLIFTDDARPNFSFTIIGSAHTPDYTTYGFQSKIGETYYDILLSDKAQDNTDAYWEQFITANNIIHYLYSKEEIAHQRGSSDELWDYLPPNCTYSDDYDLLQKAVKYGNLDPEFIENWDDSDTLWFAWW